MPLIPTKHEVLQLSVHGGGILSHLLSPPPPFSSLRLCLHQPCRLDMWGLHDAHNATGAQIGLFSEVAYRSLRIYASGTHLAPACSRASMKHKTHWTHTGCKTPERISGCGAAPPESFQASTAIKTLEKSHVYPPGVMVGGRWGVFTFHSCSDRRGPPLVDAAGCSCESDPVARSCPLNRRSPANKHHVSQLGQQGAKLRARAAIYHSTFVGIIKRRKKKKKGQIR